MEKITSEFLKNNQGKGDIKKRRISASVKDSRLWCFPVPLREAPFILFVGLYANPRDSSAQANRAFTSAIHALTLDGALPSFSSDPCQSRMVS